MARSSSSRRYDVDALLRNAELRDALEPFMDETLAHLENAALSTEQENEYLASMLAWEHAPVLPISQWFEPELHLPPPKELSDEQVNELLWDTLEQLYTKGIFLDRTDHLSDRQLYVLIRRDILPSLEKKFDGRSLKWDCIDPADDEATWLRYYATERERQAWAAMNPGPLPRRESAPFQRHLPGAEH